MKLSGINFYALRESQERDTTIHETTHMKFKLKHSKGLYGKYNILNANR
jgi:hypothetical protein